MSTLRQVLSSRKYQHLTATGLLIQDKGTGAVSNKQAADRCKKSCSPVPVWSSHRRQSQKRRAGGLSYS